MARNRRQRNRRIRNSDEVPPVLDTTLWTDHDYNVLRESIKANITQSLKKKVVCISKLPTSHEDIKYMICNLISKALENPENVVLITHKRPCDFFSELYSEGSIKYKHIRAYVLWNDFFKPIYKFQNENITCKLELWYNRVASGQFQRRCIVCYDEHEKTRWCATCGEHTCFDCYRSMSIYAQWPKCPNCRSHLDVYVP